MLFDELSSLVCATFMISSAVTSNRLALDSGTTGRESTNKKKREEKVLRNTKEGDENHAALGIRVSHRGKWRVDN